MNVDMDSIVISIESTTERASNAIDSLISKLNDLQTALSNVGKSSNNFKKIANNIPKISSKAPSTNTSDIKNKIESIKPDLKGFNVASVLSSENIKGITTEITKYKNELGNTITVQKKMKDGMEQYYRVTKKTTTDGVSGFKKLKDSVLGVGAKLTAMIVGAKRLAGMFAELLETSAEYTEAVNLFYTEMGDKAEEAEAFVKKFSDALYLDPSSVMEYMGAFHALANGLGIGANNAYKMSKNMTQLVYDFASYANLSDTAAHDKLISALSGQIKGVKQYGVALSQNNLQELANELGIKRKINTLDEASKAQLRYIQIMRASANWQSDLGKTMMSTENILRSARTQWTLMVRALGDVAAVIARVVMPYFIALTQIVKEAAVALAKFFGLNINFSDDFKKGGKSASIGLGQIEDGIGGVGSAAKKAKKDINSMLAPFDDLNVVQTKLDNAGSGIGGGASAGASLGDLPLPEYDALSKLTKEWSSEIDKAKEKLKEIIPIVTILAGIIGGIWVTNKIAKFISSIKTIGTAFGVLKGIMAKVGTVLGIGGGPATALVLALAAGFVIAVKAAKPLTKIFDNLRESNDGLVESFNKLNLKEKIAVLLSFTNPISAIYFWFRMLKGVIDELRSGKSLGEIFQSWFPNISKFATNAYNAIKGFVEKSFDKISSVFGTIGKWFSDHVVEPIKKVVTPIYNWFKSLFESLHNTFASTLNVIVGLISGTIEIVKRIFDVGKSWLNDNIIKPVGDLFGSIWNGIKDGAKKAWEGIKSVFSPVATFFGDIFSKAWEKVKIVFSVGGKIFDGIKTGITNAFKTIVNKIISGINTVVAVPFNAINSALNKIRSIDILGIKPFEKKWKQNPISVPKIPQFESGGYPDRASLFWASENGIPEMVGRIGNQTAVANNDQITTSITNALITALSGMNFGGQGTTVVNIGNKQVYEGMGEYLDGESERYGTAYVNI